MHAHRQGIDAIVGQPGIVIDFRVKHSARLEPGQEPAQVSHHRGDLLADLAELFGRGAVHAGRIARLQGRLARRERLDR